MRRQQLAFIVLIGLTTSIANALETPLIMRPPPGSGRSSEMVVIDPGLGTIQMYDVQARDLQRRTELNFLSWLEFITKSPADMQRLDRLQDWSLLRAGKDAEPSYLGFLEALQPARQQRRNDDDGPSTYERAMATEDAFWVNEPTYNGRVRGAMDSDVILLVIPSHFAVLMFRYQRPNLQLIGWMNYRSQLLIPTQWNSQPTRSQIWNSLPAEIREEHGEALRRQLEDREPGEVPPITVRDSDPWIVATGERNRFVMLDPPNNKMMLYEFRSTSQGGQLLVRSVRSLDADLLIPTAYQSRPEHRELLNQYNQELRRARQPAVSAAYLRKLAAARSRAADSAPVHANIDENGNIFVNYTEQNMLLVYHVQANRLDLRSARNYTIESGIAQHKRHLQEQENARNLMNIVTNRINQRNAEGMMRLVRWSLEWNPHLYEDYEKSRRIRTLLEDLPEWQQAIVAAEQASRALKEEQERIETELAEEEARRRGR